MTGQDTLFAMMQLYAVDPPDTSDVEDVRRALIQLRERLVVQYKHVASLGELPAQIDAGDEPEDVKASRKALLTEMARPNSRRRKKTRRRQARRNPLSPEEVEEAVRFASTEDVDPDAVPGLRTALARERSGTRRQQLSRAVVESLFPTEGTGRGTWSAERRFPEALGKYDLVTRLGLPEIPPADADPDAPFTNRAALDYIMDSSGLSLKEARSVLEILKSSADNKAPSGADKAMQPSSAMCKASRTRKVAGYALPAELSRQTGFDSVVILVSPKGQQPRVMTFRHGSHIDCDLVGSAPTDVLRLIGRALQISLYWLAEKPKRLQKTRVFLAQVGSPEVFLAWAPGNPVSVEVAMTNIRKGAALRVPGGVKDVADYVRAVKSTFGASGIGPESRVRDFGGPTKKMKTRVKAPTGQAAASEAEVETEVITSDQAVQDLIREALGREEA